MQEYRITSLMLRSGPEYPSFYFEFIMLLFFSHKIETFTIKFMKNIIPNESISVSFVCPSLDII